MTKDEFILKSMIGMASDPKWIDKDCFSTQVKDRADEMANAAKLMAQAAEDVCGVEFDGETNNYYLSQISETLDGILDAISDEDGDGYLNPIMVHLEQLEEIQQEAHNIALVLGNIGLNSGKLKLKKTEKQEEEKAPF